MLNHPNTRRHQQVGVSLVELMVGMVVGLLIIAAAGAMFLSSNLTGRDALNASKLNVEARGTLDLMVEEIRRASASHVAGADNPYAKRGSTDLAVYDNGNCIVFGLDRNWNSDVTPTENAEFTGFKVSGGTISVLKSAADTTVCPTDNWESLTDPNRAVISALNAQPYFEISYQCMNSRTNAVEPATPTASATGGCVIGNTVFDTASIAGSTPVDLLEARQVTIRFCATIAGQPACGDGTTRMQLEHTVLVRNHRIITVP